MINDNNNNNSTYRENVFSSRFKARSTFGSVSAVLVLVIELLSLSSSCSNFRHLRAEGGRTDHVIN